MCVSVVVKLETLDFLAFASAACLPSLQSQCNKLCNEEIETLLIHMYVVQADLKIIICTDLYKSPYSSISDTDKHL